MTIQNYLIINTNNIVDSSVMWDGGDEWNPPEGSIAVPQETTPASIWVCDYNANPPTISLQEVMGAGNIGFIWDGKTLMTPSPKPNPPKPT